MLIEGPFKFAVMENDYGNHELQLSFREEFQNADLPAQGEAMESYWRQLTRAIAELDESDPDRQGVLIVQQVTEQLLPHIKQGEVPLDETLVIQITPESPISKFLGIDLSNKVQ